MMPYGCAGCRCWTDDLPAYGLDRETWYPNALCPHHGMLADGDAEGTAPAPPQPTSAQAEEAYAYLREELHSGPSAACPYEGMYGPHEHIPGADSDVCIVAAEQPNREQNDHGDGVTIFTACRRWVRRVCDRAWRLVYGDVDYWI